MTVHADIAKVQRGEAAGIEFLRRPGSRTALPLVLLHGIGSNAASFSPFMNAFAPAQEIVAWDAPGYGRSQPLGQRHPAPADYAQAAKQWLAALKIERCILVGHSLGALFATRFAADYPAMVKALVLLSPALGYRVAPGAALPETVQSRIDEIETLGPAAFAAKRAARLVGNAEQNPQIVAGVQRAMAAVHPAGYTQAVRALGAGDLLGDAARVKSPVMIAVGDKDVITPPDNARTAQKAFSDAAFHLVSGAGHALPQEQPETVARLVEDFAARHAHV